MRRDGSARAGPATCGWRRVLPSCGPKVPPDLGQIPRWSVGDKGRRLRSHSRHQAPPTGAALLNRHRARDGRRAPRRRPRRAGCHRTRAGGRARPEGRPHRRARSGASRPASAPRPSWPPRSPRTPVPRSSRSTPRTRPGPRSSGPSRAPRSSSTSATATAGRAGTGRAVPAHPERVRAEPGRRRGRQRAPVLRRGVDRARCVSRPNAVVLLHHLCYASGNTEPGLPEGTQAQADRSAWTTTRRGSCARGPRAVVAEGHLGPAYYVKALLPGGGPSSRSGRRSPTANGNAFAVASVRSPGLHRAPRPGHRQRRLLPVAGLGRADRHRGPSRRHGESRAAVVGPPPSRRWRTSGFAFGNPSLRHAADRRDRDAR